MHHRILLVCFLALWLAGCQWLPMSSEQEPTTTTQVSNETLGCDAEVPGFTKEECLLPEWIAFGLASQRGDSAWRSDMLERLQGEQTEVRLARATALAWGAVSQWKAASELYKADLHAAPPELQPLLRYWLNELERRREAQYRLYQVRQSHDALETQKQTLDEKLDALTDIERNINSRQQNE